ncbi:HAD-IIIC family phosphatase [Acetobacter vaccinii]|uniref:HAD-IIIC family phosphatase n=1 Tax=Acetobacter vaccinii TaxID=2592655 RepID=A0A5C1YNL7_9PROT|nr:HAD-IIIC family phosphatase [Acetobacter vaccinii]QEO17561.1 HAD-IIIC family phosphatase [Acetobacter vaccinii]
MHSHTDQSPLSSDQFLFPPDLERTPAPIHRVLLVGSCLTALYMEQFGLRYPDIRFDYLAYNFVSVLPESPPAPVAEYDFQYVQIPLRTVLSDRVVAGHNLNDPAQAQAILHDALSTLDMMLESALRYNRSNGLLTFVANFIAPQQSTAPSLAGQGEAGDLAAIVRHLNQHLTNKINEYSNAYVLDTDSVASSIGKRYVLDDMIYFHSHNAVAYQDWDDFGRVARNEPIPPLDGILPLKRDEFIASIFRQIVSAFRTVRQIDQVKAVVFDLDNTLWRGQIAEHYRPDSQPWPRTDGWPLGVWEAIHALRARGILVAVCSKNDEAYVREHWQDVVNPAFISLDDFASIKINWRPKAENISAICAEFSLRPKNVVFVDDNPVERASVVAALPDIRAIGGNPYMTRRILLWSAETRLAHLTQESAKREDMVRGQMAREKTRTTMNREDFLASLNCSASVTYIDNPAHPEVARALELTNRTNQFNTSGKRWSFQELSTFLTEGGRIATVRVTDRFTEYGLVAVLYFYKHDIVQYVMSCRVLGMDVEESIIATAIAHIRATDDTQRVTASVHDLSDNTPCRDVYTRCGFYEDWFSDGVHYYILDTHSAVESPAHVQVTQTA